MDHIEAAPADHRSATPKIRLSRKLLRTAPLQNNIARLQTSSNNDNSSDHNDICADFGATWQIRCTTIHGRLRISGRLYELRPFAMRACVGGARHCGALRACTWASSHLILHHYVVEDELFSDAGMRPAAYGCRHGNVSVIPRAARRARATRISAGAQRCYGEDRSIAGA